MGWPWCWSQVDDGVDGLVVFERVVQVCCSLVVVWSEIVIVSLFSRTYSPHDLLFRWSSEALLESSRPHVHVCYIVTSYTFQL